MSPSSSCRKPGGQPGNTNALRHGLYSLNARLEFTASAEADQDGLLQKEIEILRGAMHQVIEMSSQPDGPDGITVLHALTIASANINRLLRTQYIVTSAKRPNQELRQAVKDVLREIQIYRQAKSDSATEPDS